MTPESMEFQTYDAVGINTKSWLAVGYGEAPNAEQIAKSETVGLYFKVANAVQNIQLIDVGKINQTLNDIGAMTMRECAVVIKTEKTGTSECRIWSDGYMEQSGLITRDATGGVQIYFLYPFKNNDYEMNFTQETLETYTTKTGSYYQPYITEKKKESVYVCCQSAIAQIGYIRWSAKGYINTVV